MDSHPFVYKNKKQMKNVMNIKVFSIYYINISIERFKDTQT
jgi:hypothetical protein